MSNILLGSQIPVPVGPSGAYSLAGCTGNMTTAPPAWKVAGAGPDFPQNFAQNAANAATAAAYGGPGAYGIVSGLTFGSPTGLSQPVTAGVVMANGEVEVSAGTVTLSDNTRNYVWVTQGGTLVCTTLLTAPAGGVACIGAVTVASGAVTATNYCGVYLKGGNAIRSTADVGMPSDAPHANTLFLSRTRYGLWLWTGTEYLLVSSFGQVLFDFPSDANHTLTQAEYEASLLRVQDSDSHLTASRSIVFPAILSPEIRVVNETDYAITCKIGSSTGVTIASGKSAAIYLNGSDAVRLSADF